MIMERGGGGTLLWHVLGHVLLYAEQTNEGLRFRDTLIVQDFLAQRFTNENKRLKNMTKLHWCTVDYAIVHVYRKS
jgi:hypothetical protein